MNKEHILMCIMAESAAGKDRVTYTLCQRNNLKQLISYTTRPRRTNEGDTHIFVDDDTYKKMKDDNSIAAYTYINNAHYWSTIDQLYEADIYVIDPLGVESLKAMNLPDLRIITVYLNVPEDIRKERAKMRGDDMTVYRKRCMSEREQFRNMKKNMDVDYVIPNVEFPKAYSVLKWIMNVENVWQNYTEDTTE